MSFQIPHLNMTPQQVNARAFAQLLSLNPKRLAGRRGRYLTEALVAVRALVVLVGVVRLQVAHLGRGVGEGLVAVVALVRLLAAVHQLVALQVARRGEGLAAQPAGVARLPRVPLAVEVEQADLPVALAAGGAGVGLQGARRREEARSQRGKTKREIQESGVKHL